MPSVWYATKPGEPRKYAMAERPLPETTAALAREGFELYRIDFELPELSYQRVVGQLSTNNE